MSRVSVSSVTAPRGTINGERGWDERSRTSGVCAAEGEWITFYRVLPQCVWVMEQISWVQPGTVNKTQRATKGRGRFIISLGCDHPDVCHQVIYSVNAGRVKGWLCSSCQVDGEISAETSSRSVSTDRNTGQEIKSCSERKGKLNKSVTETIYIWICNNVGHEITVLKLKLFWSVPPSSKSATLLRLV